MYPMADVDKRLKELGIVLPEVGEPLASFVHAVTTGNLVYTSGNGCEKNGELLYKGKLGQEVTTEEGYEAAQIGRASCREGVKRGEGRGTEQRRRQRGDGEQPQ